MDRLISKEKGCPVIFSITMFYLEIPEINASSVNLLRHTRRRIYQLSSFQSYVVEDSKQTAYSLLI